MNFEKINPDNENRKENALELFSEGKNILDRLSKEKDILTDSDFEDLFEEAQEILWKLKKESGREYTFLIGRAIPVYRRIGKQIEADELLKDNAQRN